jgi:integrase
MDLAAQRRTAGERRLMWNPVSGGDVGTKVSNDFTAYLKSIGLHDETGKKVLHSFRHTFKTKAGGYMPSDVVDSLVGHAKEDSTGGRYVHYLKMPREEHVPFVSKLDFGLNLAGLKALLGECIRAT